MRKRTGVLFLVVVGGLSVLGWRAALGGEPGASSDSTSVAGETESSNNALQALVQEVHEKKHPELEQHTHPTVLNVDGMRAIALPDSTDGQPAVNIPDLDDILDRDQEDNARTSQVAAYLKEKLPPEANMREVKVHCVDSFCRVVMVKPKTGVEWHVINERVFENYLTGESIFTTRMDGDLSTGFIYFAQGTNTLPIGAVQDGVDPDGA